METKKEALQMYALIDASSVAPEINSAVENVIAIHGQRIRHGVVMTPHGESKITFFEIRKKCCPIVESLTSLVRMYPGLYPMYVVQENKDHLPKHVEGSKSKWWMVDEVKFEIWGMDQQTTEEWKAKYFEILKRIYREESVFIKSFIYLGKSGALHVMSFNSERTMKFRGGMLGVPEWNEAMDKVLAEVNPDIVSKMAVRYTNIDE